MNTNCQWSIQLSRIAILIVVICIAAPFASGQQARDEGVFASRSTPADLAEQKRWQELTKELDERKTSPPPQPDGTTALHWAVHHEQLDVVQLLLEKGWQADRKNDYGISPLILACENGNPAIIRELINAGADPQQTIPGKVTPLMIASRSGNAESVKLLLQAGARVNHRERRGQTALIWAAAEGHDAVVDLLLRKGADVNAGIPNGMTALFFAARQGKLPVVKRLLQEKIDVNHVIKPNRTPRGPRPGTSALMLAVENAHFELAVYLIENGADPNDERSGFAPLHAVSWVRKTKVGDNPEGDPPPRGSGKLTSLQFVREIVKRGAKVNLQLTAGSGGRAKLNPKGSTPFMLAAKTADLPLMKTFMDLGADPSLNNADDTSPLMAACGVGVSAVGEEPGTEEEVLAAVRYLVELGQDVNHVDRKGETPMHGAAYHNYPRVVALLNELGARPEIWNRKNRWGATPIMIAGGARPGSFKPSPETIAALERCLATGK